MAGSNVMTSTGFWGIQGDRRKALKLNPMEQASEVRHLLTDYLRQNGFAAGQARIQHLVVLPHTDTNGYDAHDFRAHQVVDTHQMKHLVARLITGVNDGDGHQPLTSAGLEELTSRRCTQQTGGTLAETSTGNQEATGIESSRFPVRALRAASTGVGQELAMVERNAGRMSSCSKT